MFTCPPETNTLHKMGTPAACGHCPHYTSRQLENTSEDFNDSFPVKSTLIRSHVFGIAEPQIVNLADLLEARRCKPRGVGNLHHHSASIHHRADEVGGHPFQLRVWCQGLCQRVSTRRRMRSPTRRHHSACTTLVCAKSLPTVTVPHLCHTHPPHRPAAAEQNA